MAESPMNSLLGGIKDVSGGVIGTCFVVEGHLFGTTLPGYSGKQEVTRAAEAFRSTLAKAEELGLDVAYSTVTFGDTRVLFADLGGPVLAVFHQEETDVGALTEHLETHRDALMRQAQQLVADSRSQQGEHQGPRLPSLPFETQTPVSIRVQPTAPTNHNHLHLPPPVSEGNPLLPFSNQLDKLHATLLSQVGPAADAILDDALDAWLDRGQPTKERLSELIERVCDLLPSRRLRDALRADAKIIVGAKWA